MNKILIAILALMIGGVASAATLKIATVTPEGSQWMKDMRASAKEIKERTDGRVQIKYYGGGVMGNDASGVSESFEDGLLEYPQYTRPQSFEGQTIPQVLTSGNHARVEAWRRQQAEALTRDRRPDLIRDKKSRDGVTIQQHWCMCPAKPE